MFKKKKNLLTFLWRYSEKGKRISWNAIQKGFHPIALSTYEPHIKHLENRFNFLSKYLQPVYIYWQPLENHPTQFLPWNLSIIIREFLRIWAKVYILIYLIFFNFQGSFFQFEGFSLFSFNSLLCNEVTKFNRIKIAVNWARTTDTQRGNSLHCTAENSLPLPNF